MKIRKGGWTFLIIGLLMGVASALFCLLVSAPPIVANTLPLGVAAGTVFSFRSKWMV